jgi:hypothetical protein
VVGIPQYVWARNAKGLRRSRGKNKNKNKNLFHHDMFGIPQYVWARNAKGLRRSRGKNKNKNKNLFHHDGLWHSVEIWARNLAKDGIPVPAILHRQLPCLLHHNFLFRPKLSTQGLIWNSISWHYTFNITQSLYILFSNCKLPHVLRAKTRDKKTISD